MNAILTIQEKLKDLRIEKGLNLEQLAQHTGISKSALGRYEADEEKDISIYNLVTLAKFYDVSTDYLLGLTENKHHINTALSTLHLNDSMIDLLKSGNINTRLICELATHKDFPKVLTDIEIYVDGIAAMQIQNLNAYLTAARNMVEKKYQSEANDRHQKILVSAHIDEDKYFASIVHDDIDSIIQDIKENHRGDRDSAPNDDWVKELEQDIEYASSIQGTPQKRQAALYCRRLGIDYKKLTEVEFETLIGIMQKSKLLRNPGGERNRGRKSGNKR